MLYLFHLANKQHNSMLMTKVARTDVKITDNVSFSSSKYTVICWLVCQMEIYLPYAFLLLSSDFLYTTCLWKMYSVMKLRPMLMPVTRYSFHIRVSAR